MEINDIITQLQSKFGNGLNVPQITNVLSGLDLKNISMPQIISMLSNKGLLGDLDGDGKVESPIDELKGMAAKALGNKIGGIFGK